MGKICVRPACKPRSVRRSGIFADGLLLDDHLSRRHVAMPFKQSTRDYRRNGGAGRSPRSEERFIPA